jgi:hypothetical protein
LRGGARLCNPERVKLLEAEPVAAPEVAPEASRAAPPEQAPAPPEAGRTCQACGAPMEADQDWCLTCGKAAPGSMGDRPGWRAASTVIVLTLLLVLGAVGAGYAALKGDNSQKAAATPPPAAAPPQAQVAPPTTPAPTTSTPTTSTPTTTTKPKTLPKVHATKPPTTSGSPVTPVQSTTSTSTPTTSTPTTSTPTTSTPTTTQPQDTGPQPIELKTDAGSVYDPYTRAKASGTTERALDGDTSTSWYVDPKDAQSIGVGYAVDLGKLQGIREVQLQTSTPGFKMEIYATDEAQPPPNILDTRWSHIKDVSKVGTKHDGDEKIVLGAGTTQYRNLLLWFTTPPTDGARLRLVELKLLG